MLQSILFIDLKLVEQWLVYVVLPNLSLPKYLQMWLSGIVWAAAILISQQIEILLDSISII